MSRSLRVNNSTNWKFCRSMNQQVVFLDGPQLPSFRLKSKLERLQKYAFYCERLIHRNLLNRKDCLARNKPSRPSLKERLSMGGKVFVEKYGALFQNPYAADAELQEFQPVQNDTSNDAEELTEIIKDSKEDITYIERDSDLKVGEDNINLIYQQDLDSSASIFGDHHSFKFSTVHHSASSPDLRSNENLIENIDHPPYMSLRDFSSFNDWNMTRLDWLRAIRDSREKETHVQRIETELKPKIRDSVIWETVRYQASGYTPRFVNLERSSQWYGLLKNMHGCVPLSAFLMEPSHNHDCSEDALHKLKLVCGNAHFCTRDEYRLEDSKHHTYLGLLEDGSPATVRRLNTSTSTATEVGMLLFKKRSLKHKNVLKFYDAVVNPVNNHLYAVSELCEYSLRQYLKRCSDCNGRRPSPYSAPFDAKLLITDLMGALKYLHRMQIVHGFLKPSNILVTDYGTLKVADLYLLDCATLVHGIHDTEVKLCPIGLELSDFCWRPYEVIQSSNEEEARSNIGTASDIQMAGMIVYYILTGGRHPFGSTERECQENILLGQPALGGEPGDTESRVLIQDMIRKEESERPLISEVTLHPYFWDIEKRFLFLTLVARKIDFYTKKKTKAAEAFRDSCIEAEDWVSSVPTSLMTYIVQAANRKFGNNFADLLKFSLEIKDSFDRMPQNLKLMVKHPSHYILQVFPTFFMSVYHVIKNSLLLQRQMELLSFFNAFIT